MMHYLVNLKMCNSLDLAKEDIEIENNNSTSNNNKKRWGREYKVLEAKETNYFQKTEVAVSFEYW